jgi:hypothetical protein
VPMCAFVNVMATLELVFNLCGVPGSVGEPERRSPSSAAYKVHW